MSTGIHGSLVAEKRKKAVPKRKNANMSSINVWRDGNEDKMASISGSSSGVRQIEVHQNWLARLFRVKPATRYLCLTIPKRRARQEIAILLREWRRFGIRDVEVDKERNVIFARVGAKNCKPALSRIGNCAAHVSY